MSNSERDTHFSGFANLLMQELDEQVGAVATWGLEHDIDSQEKIGQELYSRWQTLIAQRAYDFMEHIMLYAPAVAVPDMTEWPEPEQGGNR